ncbi:MAG: hypothetical protein ABR915_07180 [Thermoguttaceae bacterium]|jgi:hypothetical protein
MKQQLQPALAALRKAAADADANLAESAKAAIAAIEAAATPVKP